MMLLLIVIDSIIFFQDFYLTLDEIETIYTILPWNQYFVSFGEQPYQLEIIGQAKNKKKRRNT